MQWFAAIVVFLFLWNLRSTIIAARGRELQAQTDLNKAISEFQRATGTTLSANNVDITDTTNLRISPKNRPAFFNTKLFTGFKER